MYTERPTTRRSKRELKALRKRFPGISLLVGTDDLWNWQQIATADIIVLSLSMYSVVPALLNPNALVIGPKPEALDGKPMAVMRMSHWLNALNHNGTLGADVMQELQVRFGKGVAATAAAGSAVTVPHMQAAGGVTGNAGVKRFNSKGPKPAARIMSH